MSSHSKERRFFVSALNSYNFDLHFSLRMLVMQLEITVDCVLKSAEMAKKAGVPVLLKTSPLTKMCPAVDKTLKLSTYAIVNENEACVLLDLGKQ